MNAIAISILLTVHVNSAPASAPAPHGQPTVCYVTTSATGFTGAQGVVVNGVCKAASNAEPVHHGPPTRIIDCGRDSAVAPAGWNRQCGSPRSCTTIDPRTHQPVPADAFATLSFVNGRWGQAQVWCPQNSQPGIDPATVRQRALRLLPPVAIGAAWSHTALVNAEVIFWADTPTDRSLPTVTVAGQPVHLRLHLASAHWNYGDTTTETTATPGRPYTPTDPCHSAQCPDYHGHTYRSTGPVTITLTLNWHAQYQPPHSSWLNIPDQITGPATHHTLTVKQAHAVLIPNP